MRTVVVIIAIAYTRNDTMLQRFEEDFKLSLFQPDHKGIAVIVARDTIADDCLIAWRRCFTPNPEAYGERCHIWYDAVVTNVVEVICILESKTRDLACCEEKNSDHKIAQFGSDDRVRPHLTDSTR